MDNEVRPEDLLDIDEFLRRLEHYLEDGKGSPSYTRGKSYALSGAVAEITTFADGEIFAKVRGTRRQPYRLNLCPDVWIRNVSLDGDCSCPVGADCKHCYAAAIRMLGELAQEAPWAVPWARKHLPRPWSQGANQLPHCRFLEIHPWTYIQKKSDKKDKDANWWREFLDATTSEELRNTIQRGIEKRCVPLPRFFMEHLVDDILRRFTSRVELLRQLNTALADHYRQISTQLQEEPELRAWLDSPDATSYQENEARRALLMELDAWISPEPNDAKPEDHVDFEWTIQAPTPFSMAPRLCYRVYLTSKKLRRSQRNGSSLYSLMRDVREFRRKLPPLQKDLMDWIDEQGAFGAPQYQVVEFPVVAALSWLQHWGEHDLLHWETGEVVRFLPAAAKLTLRTEGDDVTWCVQAIDMPEPRPLNAFQIVVDKPPPNATGDATGDLFLIEGNTIRFLNATGIPTTLLRSILQMPKLPLQWLRDGGLGTALLDKLQQIGLQPDPTLVQKVPVRIRASFHFSSDQTIHARFQALGPEDLSFVRDPSGHWIAHNAHAEAESGEEVLARESAASEATPASVVEILEAAARPEAIAYSPREEDLAGIETWITELVPPFAAPGRTPAGLPSLAWKLHDQGFERFFEAWEGRPHEAEYLGNSAMRALITLRTPPRYKVTVKASGIQWLDVSVDTQRDVDALSYEEVEEALRTQDSAQILLPKRGRYRREDLESYRQELETFAQLGIAAAEGKQRIHALQLGAANLEALPEQATNLAELLRHARELSQSFKGIARAPLSKALKDTLRHYQRDGVDFCVWACKNFGGAILADDMGLGKTLQVLATLTALRRGEKNKKPSLVVCPASVTHNWQREAARFTPKLRTVILERGAERKKILQELDRYDLVIKNYALARRDIEELREQEWQLVCVDEAQAIKNPDAAITHALNSLQAEYRIALTGTPIENRLTDLWSISNFAVPGYLPKDEMGEKKITEAASALEYRRLRARLRPILLRRIKQEVAPELPPRIEERLDCAMTAGQRKAYLVELKRAQLLLEEAKTKKVSGPDRIQILAALTRLRQLCCDPALRGLPKAGSGKVKVFLEQLSELIDSGHKVLVFSQFVTMLELLAPKLTERNIPYFMLTGKTQKRGELVAEFEAAEEASAFLISLKAGGSGLNLVSASHVILFDPWWNPAVEAQAIDRTHRIGQDKTVLAYRLVTEDSIEERILELQDKKRALVSNVLEADSFNRSLTRDDFAFLLK